MEESVAAAGDVAVTAAAGAQGAAPSPAAVGGAGSQASAAAAAAVAFDAAHASDQLAGSSISTAGSGVIAAELGVTAPAGIEPKEPSDVDNSPRNSSDSGCRVTGCKLDGDCSPSKSTSSSGSSKGELQQPESPSSGFIAAGEQDAAAAARGLRGPGGGVALPDV